MSENAEHQPPVDELQGETTVSESEELSPEDSANQGSEATAESDQKDGEESSEHTDKKPSGIERRFKKITAQLSAQQQELEYWKNVAVNGKPVAAASSAAPKTPKLADFDNIEDFISAREQHMRQQLISEMQQRTAAEMHSSKTISAYESRVREAQAELPDWQDVMMGALDEPTSPETVEFCLESDAGPKIAYYLAKNPDVHERINSLSPSRRLAELGKIEDRVSTSRTTQQQKITRAPSKMSDVKGNNDGPVSKKTSEAGSYAEWKALRDRQATVKRK